MRIVGVYRYFWPDNAPYGRILKKLSAGFVKGKNECMIISGYPAYNFNGKSLYIDSNEYIDGVLVKRVSCNNFKNRFFDFIIFWVKSFFLLIKTRKKYDLLIINSFPPIFMGLWGRIVTILLKKKYIYHIQDVHPECLYFSGALKNKFLFRFLRYIDRKNVDQSVATVTLSLDMKEELVSRGCQSDKIFIVNNPAQSEFSPFDDLDLPLEFPTDKFVILFAGNMGKYQNLGLIVEAAKSLRHNDQIIFVFMGDGTARNDLKEQAGDCVGKNVRFIPYQQPEVAGKAMQIASLGLVSLQSSITRFAYPSKIPTLLCHGCPILALIEDDSEIFNMIVKNRLGYVVQSRDPQEIADFIENIWEKNELSDIKNKDFRERVEDIFGFDTIMAKWEDVFDLMR